MNIDKEDRSVETEADDQEEPAEIVLSDRFYLVLSNNTADEIIELYSYTNGQVYEYYYSLETNFLDKYGKLTSAANVGSGKVVVIGNLNPDKKLTRIQITDQVWEYTNVKRFSIDEDRAILQIADSKYSWKSNLRIFSNEEQVSLSDISDNDILTVTGYGKQILSIVITTGHGTLALSNTELFEGSYMQLGSRSFSLVTKNMTMEVPEGTYTLTVANDGWGGSTDITITRGNVTEVDLDTIKGDGPSYGTILFQTDVEGAVILIDGSQIDDSQPVSLKYGAHSLVVSAEGYTTWKRTLYVNSEEATILITLNGEEEADTETETEESTESEKASKTETESESEKNYEGDYLKDYLSTLSSIIDSLN